VSRLFRFGFFALLACGSAATGALAVTLGGETDTISRSPSVDTYVIEAVDHQGNRQSLMDGGAAKWSSGSTLDLGQLPQSLVASIQLTGSDSNGNPVIWGAVPFASLGAFDGLTIPFFVQRKGELARMPGNTFDDRAQALLATSGRGVYIAGGGDRDLAAYDMLMLDNFSTTCPHAPAKSFALVISPTPNTDGESAMAWRIDDNAVTIVGLAQCTQGYEKLVNLDGGPSWSDFSGGQTVMGDDKSAYVVGPSRSSSPSGTIFKIAPDADASTLVDAIITSYAVTTRTGAATAWAPGQGVFIYGGATSASNSGEVVSPSGQILHTLPGSDAGPDSRQGLAAIAFDNTKTMLVAGDDQQPILVDVSCDCAPQGWGKALPSGLKLSSPALFAMKPGVFLLIGDDPTQTTRAFRLSENATDEKPFKIKRSGARGIQVETGQVVVIGGGSSTPESYVD
jgi:hypothetical protein